MLKLAVESGYFDVPRENSLTEIASSLGISDQVASEWFRRGRENTLREIELTSRSFSERESARRERKLSRSDATQRSPPISRGVLEAARTSTRSYLKRTQLGYPCVHRDAPQPEHSNHIHYKQSPRQSPAVVRMNITRRKGEYYSIRKTTRVNSSLPQ